MEQHRQTTIKTVLTEELINKYKQNGQWNDKTLCDHLDQTVADFPQKTAIKDINGSITYKELWCYVQRFAIFLLESGIKKGDVISVQLPNWKEFAIAHFAITYVGGITNPIPHYCRKKELAYFLEKAGSVLLIIPGIFKKFDYCFMINELLPELNYLKRVIVAGNTVPDGMISFQEIIDSEKEKQYPEEYLAGFRPTPDDIHILMFTSGTESKPKGVLHTHNTYGNATTNIVNPLGLTHNDSFFMPAPVTHTTGIRFGVRLPMILGATVILQDIFNPEEALMLISEEKCTFTVAATPFLHSMVNASNINHLDIRSLRIFGCGGAPIPRDLIKKGEEKLGCKILAAFGSTESPSQTINRLNDSTEKILHTDGYPVEGVEIAIFDENGTQVSEGEIGEAACRGPQLFVGYYKEPEITKNAFNDEGWFLTGDLCVIDNDGYLKVVGRKKEIIIRGGLNISVREVEDILLGNPEINHAAIIGMPDPRLGERICAYIVPKEDAIIDFEEITDYLKKKGVATIKFPERIEIVDSLPMTPTGKIQKNILKEDIIKKLAETR